MNQTPPNGLKALLERDGLNQAEFARRLNTSPQQANRLIRGPEDKGRKLSQQWLKKISVEFGWTFDEILRGPSTDAGELDSVQAQETIIRALNALRSDIKTLNENVTKMLERQDERARESEAPSPRKKYSPKR